MHICAQAFSMCVGESAVFSSHAPVLLNVLFVGVMAQVNKSSSDPETFAKERGLVVLKI